MDNGTSTSATNTSNQDTLKGLQEAYKLLKDITRPVIWFNRFIPEDSIFKGKAVDKMLQCNAHEVGYIIPERYRATIADYCPHGMIGNAFTEREPQGKDFFEFVNTLSQYKEDKP